METSYGRYGYRRIAALQRDASWQVNDKHGCKRQYKRRSRIEIMFDRLKDRRRVSTRYDRCPKDFLSAIAFAATVTLDRETTLRSADGEVETGTPSFDVNVVLEDGIVLDLDIDLGILGAGVDLSVAAAQTGAEYAANALTPVEDLAASFDAASVTPVDDHGSPVLF